MERYEEYKDSGVDWIGEIPAGWRIVPFRRFLSLYKGLAITKADLASEGVPVISYGQIHSKSNTGVATHQGLLRYVAGDCPALQSSSLTSVGDIVFADTSEDVEGCGSAFYIDRYGVYAGYHTLIAHPSDSSSGKYLAYLFQSPEWRSQIRKRVSGVKLFSVTRRILSDCTVLQPIKSEQVAVVAYLDAKTTEIDSLVEDCEREVELLQEYRKAVISEAVTKGLDPNALMKDSGIDWIGEIPEHWEASSLLRHAKLESGHTPSKSHPEWWIEDKCTIPWVTTADVHRFRSGAVTSIEDTVEHISEDGLDNSSARLLPAGTVALSRTASVGYSVVLSKPMASSQDFADWVPDDNLDSFYLLYCLRSMDEVFEQLRMGTTHKTIYMPDMRKLRIAFPPMDEQLSIVAYLDAKTAEIDSLIADYQAMAGKLREYRTSLISEAVTGKFKVPGVA